MMNKKSNSMEEGTLAYDAASKKKNPTVYNVRGKDDATANDDGESSRTSWFIGNRYAFLALIIVILGLFYACYTYKNPVQKNEGNRESDVDMNNLLKKNCEAFIMQFKAFLELKYMAQSGGCRVHKVKNLNQLWYYGPIRGETLTSILKRDEESDEAILNLFGSKDRLEVLRTHFQNMELNSEKVIYWKSTSNNEYILSLCYLPGLKEFGIFDRVNSVHKIIPKVIATTEFLWNKSMIFIPYANAEDCRGFYSRVTFQKGEYRGFARGKVKTMEDWLC